MVRRAFGAGAGDFRSNDRGDTRSGGTGHVYRDQAETLPVTDLLQADGTPISTVTASVSPKGMVQFQGPDDGTTVLWVDFGSGPVKVVASDGFARGEGIFNVKDYLAAGNGVADDTAEIQAAITAASAAGGVVYFPSGTYLISSTLTVSSSGVFVQGAGAWKTKILRSGDFGNTITFTGNDATGAVINDCGVSGLFLTSVGLTTSGAHLNLNGLARFTMRDIYMRDGFIGVQAQAVTASYWSNLYVVFTNLFGGSASSRRYIQFASGSATYSHPSCGDLFVTDFNLRGTTVGTVTEIGVNIKSADGIWFQNGHIGNSTSSNLALTNVLTEPIGGLFFSNVMCDEGTGNGLLVQGSTNSISNVQFTNCFFKGNATATQGVVTSTTTVAYNFQFTNCTVTEYTQRGVLLASASVKGWGFTNCSVRGNSYGNVGVSAGYEFSLCQQISITGGSAGGSNIDPTVSASQVSGVLIQTGTTAVLLNGVDLRTNTSRGLSINSSALGAVTAINCLTSESSTVASATTVTLPHTGDLFTISGTTTITSVVASWANRRVTLLFSGALTFTDGSNLKLAGNLSTGANTTITMVGDGVNWYETSRSVN